MLLLMDGADRLLGTAYIEYIRPLITSSIGIRDQFLIRLYLPKRNPSSTESLDDYGICAVVDYKLCGRAKCGHLKTDL